MNKIFVDETVEVNKPRSRHFFEELLIGNFDEWVRKHIAPTLAANKKKYESQRPNKTN